MQAKELIILHDVVADKYPRVGRGVLNGSALSGIADRPFVSFGGRQVYPTVFEKAACLLEGIIRYHPFADGNKRTALLAAVCMLEDDGCRVSIPSNTAAFLRDVARQEASAEDDVQRLITKIADRLKLMVKSTTI